MAGFQIVDDRDPRVVFLGSWSLGGVDKEFNQTTHGTFAGGSQARFTFNGSSVVVFGTTSNEPVGGLVLAPSSTYSIDGSVNATFNPVPTSIQYRQVFYQSPNLQNTQHVLVITSLVSNSAFWLDFFQVGTADVLPPPTSTPSLAATVTKDPQSSSTKGPSHSTSAALTRQDSTSVPAGVIAGGVIGSLVLVALMVIITWLALRKRSPPRLLTNVKRFDILGSPDYPKRPSLSFQENASKLSMVTEVMNSDPETPRLPVGGYGYQPRGLITMTATPSGSSPYGPGHETMNGTFTQVVYYQNEKSMPYHVVNIMDIPPAYAGPS